MEHNITFTLTAILFVSLVVNLLLKKIGVTTIIGYILTGVAAKYIFGIEDNNDALHSFAEFGVVFLMFMIGLEFSPEKIRSMRREVFGAGTLQLLGVGCLFFAMFKWGVGYSTNISLVVAMALTLSSTAIVLKILSETGKMGRNHARLSVGILLMQDIAVVPILITITLLSDSTRELGGMIFDAFVNSVSAVLAIYLFGKYAVSFFLRQVTRANSSELFMTAVLMIVLASASIVHFFDVPYTLGAFIAGIIISESAYKHQIESDLIPFRDLLLGIFFLSVGLLIDADFVMHNIELILATTLFVMLVKMLYVYGIGMIFYSKRTAIKTALLLSQIGEFSFVIFAFARQQEIIDSATAQIFISSIILSMLATPFIAKYVAAFSYRFARADDGEIVKKASHYDGHVIVVGVGNRGKRIVQKLLESGISYVGIEFQRDLVYDAQARGYDVIFGNATKKNIFDAVNAKSAASVIVTTDKEEELLIICEIVKHNYKNANLVACAQNEREYSMLRAAGVHFLLDASHEIGDKLIAMALSCNLYKDDEHSKQNIDYSI